MPGGAANAATLTSVRNSEVWNANRVRKTLARNRYSVIHPQMTGVHRFAHSVIRALLVAALALALASCTRPARGDTLAGTWKFADVRNPRTFIEAMTPPMFDAVEFAVDGAVKLRDGLRNRAFDGRYSVADDRITWTFKPADTPEPIEHALHYAFAKGGALVLRSSRAKHSAEQQVEWVFYRSERFLDPKQVSGDWIITEPAEDAGEPRQFRPDGKIIGERGGGDGEEHWGEYRLWRTDRGDLMITTLLWVQGSGAYAMFERVESGEGTMTLTGRVPPGLGSKPPQVLRRAAPAKP
jgi:hypothetical protein